MTIIDSLPATLDGGSIHAAAFQLAVRELEGLGKAPTEAAREEIADAILALAKAGQRDVEQLARYAVSRARTLR